MLEILELVTKMASRLPFEFVVQLGGEYGWAWIEGEDEVKIEREGSNGGALTLTVAMRSNSLWSSMKRGLSLVKTCSMPTRGSFTCCWTC